MDLIKFDRLISVNSETKNHEAKHLLNPDVDVSKTWLCAKGNEKAVVILKLERATVINKVDLGNAHSAFIEVLVGRASDVSDQFQALIPTSTFMSPNESKTGENQNKVRFFTIDDFDQGAVGKQWDLVKVVCSQPFDKQVAYGICFVKIHGEPLPGVPLKPITGQSIAVGAFFRKRKDVAADDVEKTQSISEKIREAEKPSALANRSPLSTGKISSKFKDRQSTSKTRAEDEDDNAGDNRRNADLGLDEPSPKKPRRDEDDRKDKETPKKHEKADRTADKDRHESEKKRKEFDKKRKEEQEQKLKKLVDEKRAKEKEESRKRRLEEEKRKNQEKRERDKRERRKEEKMREFKRKRKPFHRLLEDVSFVLSGYQNPDRASYRSHAIAMGASYRQDWDDQCTHLVASYINTPKCNQVKGKGKIVNKDWVEKCYKDRKRYPWRRFALDQADRRQPESDEEIEEETSKRKSPSPSSSGHSSSLFTTPEPGSSNKDKTNSDSPGYDDQTDDEADEGISHPKLPDFFHGQTFYIEDSIADKAVLERYIIAYNGVICEKLNDNANYFVTLQRGPVLKFLQKDCTQCKAVSPTWIQSVNCSGKPIPDTHFLVD